MSFALLYKLAVCHMLGDYVLQSDFLAKTKGKSWWHLVIHCVLYALPFAVAFGTDYRICWLILSHVLIDAMKARWQAISYASDQVAHVAVMLMLYMEVNA